MASKEFNPHVEAVRSELRKREELGKDKRNHPSAKEKEIMDRAPEPHRTRLN